MSNKFIKCKECGYYNQTEFVKKSGICKLCNKVIDEKAKYKYEMYVRLHLWSKKKTRNIVLKGV